VAREESNSSKRCVRSEVTPPRIGKKRTRREVSTVAPKKSLEKNFTGDPFSPCPRGIAGTKGTKHTSGGQRHPLNEECDADGCDF